MFYEPKEAIVRTGPHAGVVVALLFCIASGLPSLAREETPESYVVEDLQWVSLAGAPGWESDWECSRAAVAATIVAWFHHRGYVSLLDDWNEDGATDEFDAIELADRLGNGSMGCDEDRAPTDPWLVIGLAEVLADRFPDGFELRIYDAGFPAEFERMSGIPFVADAIPGILLAARPEPTFGDYMRELLRGAGVILGLEDEPGRNLYVAGRSFSRDPVAPDTYGIDLLSPMEDESAPGGVLETRARQTETFYVSRAGRFAKVESMIALCSLYPRLSVDSEALCDCAPSPGEDAICTVTVSAAIANAGEGPIESDFDIALVYRTGEESTQTIVRTITPQEINPTGATTLVFAFPFLPSGSESAPCTYSLTGFLSGLPAPVHVAPTAVAVPQAIHGDESGNGFFYGEGCCEGVPGCLDLVVTAKSPSCHCEDVVSEAWHSEPAHPQGGWWETEVIGEACAAKVRCSVQNVGTEDAGPFSVRIETSTGHTATAQITGLAAGHETSRWFEFAVDGSGAVTITLIADSNGEIEECNEQNNAVEIIVLCH